jgi:hypothetical protein
MGIFNSYCREDNPLDKDKNNKRKGTREKKLVMTILIGRNDMECIDG